MTVSFFLKRSQNKAKGIRDALTYGVSIIVIYVALGLAVTAAFGPSALNSLSTNAVFNILFCLLLIVFALSFFGWFEIRLPDKWGNAVDSKASSTSGILSIFLMAFTLAWCRSLALAPLSVSCSFRYLLRVASWVLALVCWASPWLLLCPLRCLPCSQRAKESPKIG